VFENVAVLGKMRAVRVSSAESDLAASSSGDGASVQMTGDQQLAVLISERQGRIIGLPTHQCYTEMKVRARAPVPYTGVYSLIRRMACCTRVLIQ
jgi:hypothetical protein